MKFPKGQLRRALPPGQINPLISCLVGMPLQVTTGLPYFLGVVKVEPLTTGSIPVNVQCPCGLVKAMVDVNNGKSGMVKFTSVPAFAFATDIKVKTKSYGELTVDIGYGGTFYILVTDKQLDLVFREVCAEELADKAEEILEVCRKQLTVTHPEKNDLGFIYGVIITDGKDNFVEFKDEPTCNMCYFGDDQVRELGNILLTSDNTSWVYIFFVSILMDLYAQGGLIFGEFLHC